jgi:CAAX protease family protein
MNRPTVLALAGLALAIAITTTMDATGLSAFSSLPLLPLAAIFVLLQRQSRREIGLTLARASDYGLALFHCVTVIGVLALGAALAGAADLGHMNVAKTCLNVGLVGGTTVLVALLTEEGFFRGWLWAAFARLGWSERAILVATSLGFAAWHISAATLAAGYRPAPAQVPVFLLNALALGLIWGMLRLRSGSIVVTSVAHGVWNGLAYGLFGFGERVGGLGIHRTALFGPEVGVLGLALNVAFAIALWLAGSRLRAVTTPRMTVVPPAAVGRAR